ncbi:neuronal-specific septin-3-like isoform X2 [Clupea harengus]|uniref:Neuronal-specific septin-3-like isoform X2 n=1 Tax=Clupea harengus TaxID=7950 RepID=A0A6P3VK51_CLUHA|nr:neuronal-specific septin-3-like isoform X2 [Clupea harengus]
MEGDKIAALKRSFEVEDVDATSPNTRRVANSHPRSAVAPSSQSYYDLGSRANHTSSPKPLDSLRPKARTPEPVSRRTELSIDISSNHSGKSVDSSPSQGVSRFALKRPEVLGHSKTPELMQKHSVTFSRPLETPVATARAAAVAPHASAKLPETTFRRTEPPSPGEVAGTRRPEISVTKAPDSKAQENHHHHHHPTISTRSASPNHPTRKSPQDSHRSEVITSIYGTMSDSAKTPQPAPAPRGDKAGTDFSYVGIDAILEQMRRKAMKQGFELNIMVVGQSGLGKSTLMNTLFKSKVSRKSVLTKEEERIPKTIEIKSISHDIEEKGVRMKLAVIDTPGFGDQINNENCWKPIMKFINDQYEQYLQEEININRKKQIPDSRVHCCIYFIPPTGHCLRPIDVEFMRHLSKVVNIVPVIAKADTLTLEERDYFKQKIREDLRVNEIDIYPQMEFDEDAEDRVINEKIRAMIPFAVVGSDLEYQVNGKKLLGRKTKWGTIEVENTAHCEFAYLRDLLIRTHMQNLKDITSSIHYEMYRVRRLNENNNTQPNGQLNGQRPLQANGVPGPEVLSHEM